MESRFTPFGLLLLAHRQSITITVSPDGESLRASSPDPTLIPQVRPFIAELKHDLLPLLTPGTPTAWVWGLYLSLATNNTTSATSAISATVTHLTTTGSIRDSTNTWWPISRTTESIITQLADRGRERQAAALLWQFHHAYHHDCQEWRAPPPDYPLQDFPYSNRPANWTGEASANATSWMLLRGGGGGGSLKPLMTYPAGNLYVRWPEGEIGYVSPHRIPAEATEHRQLLTGGLGEWAQIPQHWRER